MIGSSTTILLLLFLVVILVGGVGLIHSGIVPLPRQTCQVLGQLPKKTYECTPGVPGADVYGPQGPPGRDCVPLYTANNTWQCTYNEQAPQQKYSRKEHQRFEMALYVCWAIAVVFTVYTFKKEPYGVSLVFVLALAVVYAMSKSLR